MFRINSQNLNQKMATTLVDLRKQKHQDGNPFMISEPDNLPYNQAYMEYADGTIKLVEFSKDFRDFSPLKTLSEKEAKLIRKTHHLS